VADRLAPAAEMKDIDLRLTIEAPLPAEGDAVLVEAALRNIIDNAIKYSDADSLVEIIARAAGYKAEITVADRGRGLSGLTHDRLKRRFLRGANVGDVAGSGLGLTIVEEATTAMGGQFTLSPREGGGTCAILSLPLSLS
jgi:two-component system sensor histidine kinase TctE